MSVCVSVPIVNVYCLHQRCEPPVAWNVVDVNIQYRQCMLHEGCEAPAMVRNRQSQKVCRACGCGFTKWYTTNTPRGITAAAARRKGPGSTPSTAGCASSMVRKMAWPGSALGHCLT